MPTPVQIVQGTLTITKAADELTSGNIKITVDSQSNDGRDKPKECECPNPTRYSRIVMRLTHRSMISKLFGGQDPAVSLTIGVRWQGNGCEVIGATPFLGSGSSAGYGTSVEGSVRAVASKIKRPQQICECCQGAPTAEFAVSLVINPLIGKSITKSGYIIVAANGEVGAEWQ